MIDDPIQPFHVRDARAAGLSANDLRSRRWNHSVHSIRSRGIDMDLATRCHHFAARMPSGATFSHTTAAQLLGIPLPWRLERAEQLHIALPTPARAPHATGIRGHRLALKPGDVITRGGLPLTSPVRTWLDLAGMLDVPDLVAVGDHLLHWRRPLASSTELARGVDGFPGRRGVRRMRIALPLLSDRAESRRSPSCG